MARRARVQSIEALRTFRTALIKFAETVSSALDEADGDVRRTQDWLKPDRAGHWGREIRKRHETLTHARSALQRKKNMSTALGDAPSAVEEEIAYNHAKRRVEEAEAKLQAVRRWSQKLDREARNFQAPVRNLGITLQTDIPRALAALDHMIAALEQYARSATLSQQESVASEPAEPTPLPDPAQLRAAAPANTTRRVLRLGETSFAWHGPPLDSAPLSALLADLPQVPPAEDARVVVSPETRTRRRCFLVRSDPADAQDSGWYLGDWEGGAPPTAPPADACEAIPMADLLAAQPALARLLDLPAGYLIVFDDGRPRALIDPLNLQRWPTDPEAPA